jgi:hypothetical protein
MPGPGTPEGKAKARFLGGDRALAITSGSHHGQAIRIDSSAVHDCIRFSDRELNQSRNLAVHNFDAPF